MKYDLHPGEDRHRLQVLAGGGRGGPHVQLGGGLPFGGRHGRLARAAGCCFAKSRPGGVGTRICGLGVYAGRLRTM
jgi:hypothetical protein